MTNLFTKTAVCTDLHLGLKSNSIQHNEDCLGFIKWFISEAKKEGCETCLMLGDFHNHRATINIQTLNYSMQCMELLNEGFSKVLMLTGNHDLFFRDKRDIHSVAWAHYLPNVHVINEIFTEGNVTLCPWLVGDEMSQVRKFKSTYTFGHFELPNFYMNAQIVMPDHGNIKLTDFENTGKVFSGHFHKRQSQQNIWYVGNAFPHNYADAGDDARGMMILKWGGEPEFRSWPQQPKYRVYALSDILEKPKELLLSNAHVRVHLDIPISYEEANFIRETLIPEYSLREMSLIPLRQDQSEDIINDIKFETVDQVVAESIQSIESKTLDKDLLLSIYQAL